MSGYLGDFTTSNTVYCLFSTFSSLGASITITGLATSDIKVYKDGGTTQRSSEAGYTLLDTDGIDFDGITGIHGFSIDLSDNTDAGFYAAGHEYLVVVNSITIDAQTVNMVAGTFSIERSGGALALLKHADYGLSKLVRSTTPANTLTVDASHQALALTNAVTNDAITAAAIANGAIDAATFAAGAIDAAAIATGAIDADAIADNAIDAGAIAADAITAAKIAADVTTEIQSGLATAAELAKVPKSDGGVTWNATALASIQAEATDALNAYDPPTNAELEARTLVAADYTVVSDLGTVQTGDAYARLGAPAGASVSADIAALPTATENADEILKRDWTSVTGEAARSVLNALRFLRNKWSVAGTTLTVTEEDDSTPAWTAALTTNAAADPVTGSDPS